MILTKWTRLITDFHFSEPTRQTSIKLTQLLSAWVNPSHFCYLAKAGRWTRETINPASAYENWQSRKFWLNRKCERETDIKRYQVRNSCGRIYFAAQNCRVHSTFRPVARQNERKKSGGAAGFPLAVNFVKAPMARYILQLALSAACVLYVHVQVVQWLRIAGKIGSAHKRQSKTGISRKMTYCGWLALNLAPMRSAVNAPGRRYRRRSAAAVNRPEPLLMFHAATRRKTRARERERWSKAAGNKATRSPIKMRLFYGFAYFTGRGRIMHTHTRAFECSHLLVTSLNHFEEERVRQLVTMVKCHSGCDIFGARWSLSKGRFLMAIKVKSLFDSRKRLKLVEINL